MFEFLGIVAALSIHALVEQSFRPPAREMRGAWVATVENIDWPSKRGLDRETQRRELESLIQTASNLHLNTLIFQVRPASDCLYRSKLEPWSEYLTGEQGKDPGWDPLQYAIERCHFFGIELHAWFNPYRVRHSGAKSLPAPNHLSQTHPELVCTYAKMLWANPGLSEVQNHSLAVIEDVVKRYDIDGVHIDDYFYPYPVADTPFPDSATYLAYKGGGGKLNLGDWRRDNVNRFVRAAHDRVHKAKPWVKFGISPFGIFRPGVPEGTTARLDQYAELYADCALWLKKGWCDYFTPQLYWPIKQEAQAYGKLLDWWGKQATSKTLFVPGNFTSQIKVANWPTSEILDQIALTRKSPMASGNIHFSMKALIQNYGGIATALLKGPYAERVMVPAHSGRVHASKPEVVVQGKSITVQSAVGAGVALYGLHNSVWKLLGVTRAIQTSSKLARDGGYNALAVTTVDRFGCESLPTIILDSVHY